MDLSAVGNVQSFAGSSSPLVQLLQTQQQNGSTLFGGASGTPSDLISFTPTAAASTLFNNPALLLQLQNWDGSQTTGSARAVPSSDSAPPGPPPPKGYNTATGVVVPFPKFSFNPFDQ